MGPASPQAAQASTEKKDPPAQAGELPAGVAPRTASAPVPEVKLQRDADFTDGEGLPDGARVFNTGSNSSGMALTDAGLAHGAAESPGAAGFVETKLKGKVALPGRPGALRGRGVRVGGAGRLAVVAGRRRPQGRRDPGHRDAAGRLARAGGS